MEKIYYLPIKSVNLAHYFSKGCICPTLYIKNRNEDIQNKFNNQLLLSDIKFTNSTNCSLEIVLNSKEESLEKITEHFFLFNTPLPISRIKKVLFQDKSQKVNTLFDITSGAAFLPNELIEIDSTNETLSIDELQNIKEIKPTKDWNHEIDFFNKVMGGFAIMSIAGNEYQNYPLNYFNTLSIINDLVKDDIKIKSSHDYEWTLINNNKFSGLHKVIYSEIKIDIVEGFAKKENIKLERNNGKYLLDKIDHNSTTYLVTILASYGAGSRMNLDTFISDLVSNKFPEKRKEGIALIFGINKGYESFRNEYKTSNFKVSIKFKLDSQLDYYTIESIYQFVFNNKRDSREFDFINSWCPKSNEPNKFKDVETYNILDKIISYKKKDGSQEFQNSFQDNIYNKIVNEIQKWIPDFIKDNNVNPKIKNYFENLLNSDFDEYTNNLKVEIEHNFTKKIISQENEIEVLKDLIKSKENNIYRLQKNIGKVEKNNQLNINGIVNHEVDYKNISLELLERGLYHSTNLSDKNINININELNLKQLKKIAKDKGINNLNKYKTANIKELKLQILQLK